MNKLILTLLCFYIPHNIFANEKMELPNTAFPSHKIIGSVTLDNVQYKKITKSTSMPMPMPMPDIPLEKNTGEYGPKGIELFSGDMIKKDVITPPETISGNFIISVNDGVNIADIAQFYNMNVSYSVGNLGILTAPKNVELLSLLSSLKSDKRIDSAKLEKVSNKNKPT